MGVTSKAVRVPREEGEETRRRLAEEGALDRDLRIQKDDDGFLYIPVSAEPGWAETTTREFEERDGRTTPADVLGYEPSFEVVGDIALLEPDEPDEAGEAIVDADNGISTALRVESAVEGEERTRDLAHVAGEEATETVHREYGREFEVDVGEVYFSPRLANERERVVSEVDEGETVFDMFAGVGPFAVGAALGGADVVATDINPTAVGYLRGNAERNGVEERVSAYLADARDVAGGVKADRIVMNLPHTADEFLDAAVEAASGECVVHYYDIRHEDDLWGGEEEVREEAEAGYDVEVVDRVVVRSYAPYDYNVCLDIRLREDG